MLGAKFEPIRTHAEVIIDYFTSFAINILLMLAARFAYINVICSTVLSIFHQLVAVHTISIGSFHENNIMVLILSSVQF